MDSLTTKLEISWTLHSIRSFTQIAELSAAQQAWNGRTRRLDPNVNKADGNIEIRKQTSRQFYKWLHEYWMFSNSRTENTA